MHFLECVTDPLVEVKIIFQGISKIIFLIGIYMCQSNNRSTDPSVFFLKLIYFLIKILKEILYIYN